LEGKENVQNYAAECLEIIHLKNLGCGRFPFEMDLREMNSEDGTGGGP
jgi:hypothetical protein